MDNIIKGIIRALDARLREIPGTALISVDYNSIHTIKNNILHAMTNGQMTGSVGYFDIVVSGWNKGWYRSDAGMTAEHDEIVRYLEKKHGPPAFAPDDVDRLLKIYQPDEIVEAVLGIIEDQRQELKSIAAAAAEKDVFLPIVPRPETPIDHLYVDPICAYLIGLATAPDYEMDERLEQFGNEVTSTFCDMPDDYRSGLETPYGDAEVLGLETVQGKPFAVIMTENFVEENIVLMSGKLMLMDKVFPESLLATAVGKPLGLLAEINDEDVGPALMMRTITEVVSHRIPTNGRPPYTEICFEIKPVRLTDYKAKR